VPAADAQGPAPSTHTLRLEPHLATAQDDDFEFEEFDDGWLNDAAENLEELNTGWVPTIPPLGGLEGGGFAAYPGADPASAAHTPRSAPQSAVGGARQSCGVCGDAASGTSPGGAHGNAARSPEGTSPAGRSVAGSVAGSERAERAREAKARAEQALAEEWGVTDGRLQATMQKRQARRAATLTLTLT
jgi:hypothetical protein